VEIGRRNNRFAQVLSGLKQGEQVVLHPSDRVRDGVAVTAR
jgi:HlyD family secretion protein